MEDEVSASSIALQALPKSEPIVKRLGWWIYSLIVLPKEKTQADPQAEPQTLSQKREARPKAEDYIATLTGTNFTDEVARGRSR